MITKFLLLFLIFFWADRAQSEFIRGGFVSSTFIEDCNALTLSLDNDLSSTFIEDCSTPTLSLNGYVPGSFSHFFFLYAMIKDDYESNGGYGEQLQNLKMLQPDLMLILSIDGPAAMKANFGNETFRHDLVESVKDLVEKYNFNGIDVDMTSRVVCKQDFSGLLRSLKVATNSSMISVSLPNTCPHANSTINSQKMEVFLDGVHIVPNPMNNFNEQVTLSTFDGASFWVTNGMPKEKLNVGIGIFYQQKQKKENDVCESNSLCNEITAIDFSYLSEEKIHENTIIIKWFKQNGFGDAFIWLSNDKFDQRKPTISKQIREPCCDVIHDFDLSGQGLYDFPGAPEDCCGLCDGDFDCLAYSWTNYMGGMCWLKVATGPLFPNIGSIFGSLCTNGSTLDFDISDLEICSL